MKVNLYKALASLRNEKEIETFLQDLCTPGEIRAMKERWLVAQALYEGKLSYREIQTKIGSSLATITRVARFLKDEPYGGYRSVLERRK